MTGPVLTASERRDLLEILEDRHGRASTIVTSQLPVEHWHEAIGDPTLADAILDRVRHWARTNGASMAHSTTPTGSNSPEKACEKPPPATQALTCQHKPDSMKTSVKPPARLRVEWLPAMPWNECPRSRGISALLPWNTHEESRNRRIQRMGSLLGSKLRWEFGRVQLIHLTRNLGDRSDPEMQKAPAFAEELVKR